MKKYKIFLASSSELEEDRRNFEIYIRRKNSELSDRKIFLDLIIWEHFLDAIAKTRLQEEYNKSIKDCDIFIMLFFSKVGKFTREEFETAFGKFQNSNKPLIYTYFKNTSIRIGDIIRNDIKSLWSFQDRLSELGHYQSTYDSMDSLENKFSTQLNKIIANKEEDEILNTAKNIIDSISDLDKSFKESREEAILELLEVGQSRTINFLVQNSSLNKKAVVRILNRLEKSNKIKRTIQDDQSAWERIDL